MVKTSPRIPCGSVFSLMEGCHKSFSGRSSERSRGSLPVLGKDKKTMAVTLRLFPTKDRDKDVSPLKRDLRRKGGDLVYTLHQYGLRDPGLSPLQGPPIMTGGIESMYLPMTASEMKILGWDRPDVILVTGDAYIDSPHMGVAVIGRWLMAHGFRTAVIAQPDREATGT